MFLIHSVNQMQSLQNMYEYLLDAESQMGTDKANENAVHYSVEGGHSVPVAAGAGDTNICGGIVQLYWDSILGRCLDLNEQVRQAALKVRVSLRAVLFMLKFLYLLYTLVHGYIWVTLFAFSVRFYLPERVVPTSKIKNILGSFDFLLFITNHASYN